MVTGNKRVHAGLMLSGSFIERGLDSSHGDEMYALVHLRVGGFLEFAKAIPGWRDLRIVDLVTAIIRGHGELLRAGALMRQWELQKLNYDRDRASWEAAKADKGDQWRDKPMTQGQRYLAHSTAELLQTEIPEGMDRGLAHDWLEANGAHVLFMFDEPEGRIWL